MEVAKVNEYTLLFKYNEVNDQPNLVYFYGKDKLNLVDAGPSPKFTKSVLNHLIENCYKEPSYVLITHYHWDHSFGAAEFKSTIISSSFTIKRLKKLNNIDFCKDDYISYTLINEFSKEHLAIVYYYVFVLSS